MNDKAIAIINTNQSVPKKNKIIEKKNEAPAETDVSSSKVKPGKASRPRRKATGRKQPTMAGAKISVAQKAGGLSEPLDDAIRLRAYFISERRRRFALPGDADSDWLEAKRQLLSEADRR
jgi:outer membrane biosynthesis protein TonB